MSGVTLDNMAAGPDIIVSEPETSEALLAIEAKAHNLGVTDPAADLKDYLVGRSCPAGILVTPDTTRFYRNRYTADDATSIDHIGECLTPELLGRMPQGGLLTEERLVELTHQWLEDLRGSARESWPPSVADAIGFLVLPALTCGLVGSTGRRWRPTGS
jgi:hypothetical protein